MNIFSGFIKKSFRLNVKEKYGERKRERYESKEGKIRGEAEKGERKR
jgi:hypothetical protein